MAGATRMRSKRRQHTRAVAAMYVTVALVVLVAVSAQRVHGERRRERMGVNGNDDAGRRMYADAAADVERLQRQLEQQQRHAGDAARGRARQQFFDATNGENAAARARAAAGAAGHRRPHPDTHGGVFGDGGDADAPGDDTSAGDADRLSSYRPQCLDESGNAVDWWVVLKWPYFPDEVGNLQTGYAYSYYDDNSRKLEFSPYLVTDATQGAVANTLNTLYTNTSDVSYVMYNDDPPYMDHDSYRAHAKGVVAYNENGGFWFIHSVPDFPTAYADGYEYPDSGQDYGQSMICVDFALDKFDTIGYQLLIDYMNIYDCYVQEEFRNATTPNIVSACAGNYIKDPTTSVVTLKSMENHSFQSFAKSRYWDSQLYEYLVEPYYESGMWVETWGRPLEDSFCAPPYSYYSISVTDLKIDTDGDAGDEDVGYSYTKDHSKYAVAMTGTATCIGDINRMDSQADRGGGTMCLKNSYLHTAVLGVINGTMTTCTHCSWYNQDECV